MLGPCQVPPLPNQNLSPFQDVRAHHIGVSTQVYLSKPSILLRDRPVLQQLEGDIFKRLDFVRYRHTLFGWGQDPTQKVFSLCLYHPPAGSYPTARACAYFSWAHALRARARLVTPQTLLKRFRDILKKDAHPRNQRRVGVTTHRFPSALRKPAPRVEFTDTR